MANEDEKGPLELSIEKYRSGAAGTRWSESTEKLQRFVVALTDHHRVVVAHSVRTDGGRLLNTISARTAVKDSERRLTGITTMAQLDDFAAGARKVGNAFAVSAKDMDHTFWTAIEQVFLSVGGRPRMNPETATVSWIDYDSGFIPQRYIEQLESALAVLKILRERLTGSRSAGTDSRDPAAQVARRGDSLAEGSSEAPEVQPEPPVLSVDARKSTARICATSEEFDLTSAQVRILKRLLDADGAWVKGRGLSDGRPDRAIKRLPAQIADLIESKPGTGYRMRQGH